VEKMTGRLRKLYGVVGMIAFLLLSLAVLIAFFRASPVAGKGAERTGVQSSIMKQKDSSFRSPGKMARRLSCPGRLPEDTLKLKS
jgi:hypothetical protein